jgi:hypothetical protein
MRTLDIVVTCASRKSRATGKTLGASGLLDGELDARMSSWTELLSARGSRFTPAELYSGDHWIVARSLAPLALSLGWKPRLWIASAGFGLVSTESLLTPYSATFALGNPNSVGKSATENREWWKLLSDWEGPLGSSHRSIESVAASAPESTFLCVLSEPYLAALQDDLRAALVRVTTPDRFLVVSAGTAVAPGLEGNLLPGDARLQALLGGTLNSLNVRIAHHLLGTIAPAQFDYQRLSKDLQESLSSAPERKVPNNRRMEDVDVVRFIRQESDAEARTSHTGLLRKLRASGRACEQSRFRALYKEVRKGR